MNARDLVQNSTIFDISNWDSVCDLTLTLKQGRKNDHGQWVKIDETQCQKALKHFLHLLNRRIFKNALYRHNKRLRIIPVIEKSKFGRWHIHTAVEPPSRLRFDEFEKIVSHCWSETDWGHRRILLRPNADSGWLNYILKPFQKTGLERWSDCIDWDCLNNPIVDA